MADKAANRQPQSGAGKGEKKDFRALPDEDNKSEVGQDTPSLAPLLHWESDRPKPGYTSKS